MGFYAKMVAKKMETKTVKQPVRIEKDFTEEDVKKARERIFGKKGN